MMRLNPYINFDGNAREAMEFYRDVLGGELAISTFGEYGSPGGADPDGVMHAFLETPEGFVLMASDAMPGESGASGSNITVSISGYNDDADKMRGYFERLSEGGTVVTPLEKQMWGDEYGQLKDRFGVSWMVDFGEPQAE
jgi:PhnB protein